MRWYGVTLIFQRDGCAALYIWRETGEVTPTEDDYVDGTTSTKEYMPRTCCVATVKIRELRERVVEWHKWMY